MTQTRLLFFLFIFLYFPATRSFAQSDSISSTMVICRDTIIHTDEEVINAYWFYNRSMDISILSMDSLSLPYDKLLDKLPDISDWKTFIDSSNKYSFRYPSRYEIQKSEYSTIEKPVFEIGCTVKSEKIDVDTTEFKKYIIICFNADTFDKEATNEECYKKSGVWWVEMFGSPMLATFIKGEKLYGIWSEKGDYVPFPGGGMAASSHIEYFVWIQYDDCCAATVSPYAEHIPENWIIQIARSIKNNK